MSKHFNPVELARKNATVAPEGVRLAGPGTRSKNPQKYDKNVHLKGSASRKRTK